ILLKSALPGHVSLNIRWMRPVDVDEFIRKQENMSPELAEIAAMCETSHYFVIGSFQCDLYQCLVKNGLKAVSPLTILYWSQMAGQLGSSFDLLRQLDKIELSSDGLFSLCMDNTTVYLSKEIPLSTSMWLSLVIGWMGGRITHRLGVDITH